jgi:S1-C subfamily serine protease
VAAPLHERVVEVRADLADGADPRYRFGSGLVVGGRTVLTAAHVLAGAVAVSVRGSDKSERPAVLDPTWVGDVERCDVALIELTELAAPLEYVPVATIDRDVDSGVFVEGCWSAGELPR